MEPDLRWSVEFSVPAGGLYRVETYMEYEGWDGLSSTVPVLLKDLPGDGAPFNGYTKIHVFPPRWSSRPLGPAGTGGPPPPAKRTVGSGRSSHGGDHRCGPSGPLQTAAKGLNEGGEPVQIGLRAVLVPLRLPLIPQDPFGPWGRPPVRSIWATLRTTIRGTAPGSTLPGF